MPVVDDFGALPLVTAGANIQRDALVVKRYTRFGIPLNNGQQMPPTPEIVALAHDELPRRFPCLVLEFLLLLANPEVRVVGRSG